MELYDSSDFADVLYVVMKLHTLFCFKTGDL